MLDASHWVHCLNRKVMRVQVAQFWALGFSGNRRKGYTVENLVVGLKTETVGYKLSVAWEFKMEIPVSLEPMMNKKNPRPAGEKSVPRVSTDLRKALAAAPLAGAVWRDLTPIARRDFMSCIDSAKQPETRRRRIERACVILADGKRRPCCFSIVPFNLYKALAAAPRAKAQWRNLTPIARRGFIRWIDSAKQPGTGRRRIEKACVMLAAGKRRP
jgi:uncharacterized protein YdeI (YjbR/CyaY-like superfamily)